jgi:hypothetical protein
MQPKPVASGFITAHHRGIIGEAKPPLGGRDLGGGEYREITRRKRSQARWLRGAARATSQLPRCIAKIERDQ